MLTNVSDSYLEEDIIVINLVLCHLGSLGFGIVFKLLCCLTPRDFFPYKDLLPPSTSSTTCFLLSHLVCSYLPFSFHEEDVGVTTKVYQSSQRESTTNILIIPWWVKMTLGFFPFWTFLHIKCSGWRKMYGILICLLFWRWFNNLKW